MVQMNSQQFSTRFSQSDTFINVLKCSLVTSFRFVDSSDQIGRNLASWGSQASYHVIQV